MTRAEVSAHCATLPGAEVSDPWGGGHDCWKVGGKMFALMGAMNYGVSLKCRDASEAAMLIELGRAERAPYLPRGGWVLIRWGAMAGDELAARLTRSYVAVRSSLPKRIQASLGPEPVANTATPGPPSRARKAKAGSRLKR